MENNFNTEIISPEKIIFSGQTSLVTIPSYEGDMGILKDHISIITFLKPGILTVKKSDNNLDQFFVEDGTIEYFDNNLVILSSSVISLKDLSKEFIDELSHDTQKKLSQSDISDHEVYMLNHKLRTKLVFNM